MILLFKLRKYYLDLLIRTVFVRKDMITVIIRKLSIKLEHSINQDDVILYIFIGNKKIKN